MSETPRFRVGQRVRLNQTTKFLFGAVVFAGAVGTVTKVDGPQVWVSGLHRKKCIFMESELTPIEDDAHAAPAEAEE